MNNLDSGLIGFALGGMFSIVLLNFTVVSPMTEYREEHRAMITDCEKNKPRSIHCILTAVEKPQ